ncbi:MAG: aldehyde dehydrogenase family protein [Janthinobacterium lividum]
MGLPVRQLRHLVSSDYTDKVLSHIQHGIATDKAILLHGGISPPAVSTPYTSGFWIQLTVFTNCTDSIRITTEEISGPVLFILSSSSIAEAIQRANTTKVGLAAGVLEGYDGMPPGMPS